MILDKDDFTRKFVEKFKYLLVDTKPQLTPIDPSIKLQKPKQPMKENSFPYRPLIGSFNYLSCTLRAELSFPTNYLARFMENYDHTHIEQLIKLLRYLHDHIHASIHYCDVQLYKKYFIVNGKQFFMLPNQLYVFVDADWASMDLEHRRSTTGFLIFLNGGLISWRSCQQKRTAGSSTEAEYIALYEAVKEVIWIKHILEELNLFKVNPVIIFEDNSSTIRASENPVEHSKLKHLDINIHSIRDYVQSHDITMHYINSADQMADILSKPQTIPIHNNLAPRMLHFIKAHSFIVETN